MNALKQMKIVRNTYPKSSGQNTMFVENVAIQKVRFVKIFQEPATFAVILKPIDAGKNAMENSKYRTNNAERTT
jgi:hypothetical protein